MGIIWRALEPGPPSAQQANLAAYCAPHLASTPFTAHPELYDQATVDAYLQHIDDEINLLAAHGIYSLIDMHHKDNFNEYFNNPTSATPWEGEGAPLWAVCTAVAGGGTLAPDTSKQNPSWNYADFNDPALATAADHFWTNDVTGNLQGEFLKTWSAVATHFKDNAWVAGYDPYNEPYDSICSVGTCQDRKLQCFYEGQSLGVASCTATVPPSQAPGLGFLPTIQAIDTRHLTFYESPVATDFGHPETIGWQPFPLPFGKLVLNIHNYAVVGPPVGPNEEDLTMEQVQFDRGQTSTAQTGGPALFMSEFGGGDDVADIAHLTDIADGSLPNTVPVGWTYWAALQLHDPTGSSTERLFTADRTEVQPKGCVLTRAYPEATAGTPLTQSFDPATSAFSLSYTTDPGLTNPDTEIVLPDARYGAGYSAAVTSGAGAVQIASAANANPLVIRNRPGSAATPVSLTVTAANPAACSVNLSSNGGRSPSAPSVLSQLPNTGTVGIAGSLTVALLLLGLAVACAAAVTPRGS